LEDLEELADRFSFAADIGADHVRIMVASP
jgi:hypothetical protein